MRIRMLSSQPASPDGFNVVLYRRGEKYDLPANLAQTFIVMHAAEEDKDMGGAPEVKVADYYEYPWGNEATASPMPDKKMKKPGRKKRGG